MKNSTLIKSTSPSTSLLRAVFFFPNFSIYFFISMSFSVASLRIDLTGMGVILEPLAEVSAIQLPSSSPRIFFKRLSSSTLEVSLASRVPKKFFSDFLFGAGSSGSFPFFFWRLFLFLEFS